MCRHANIIVSYKTYPHVDMRDAAFHAGQALEFAMETKLRIKTIIRQPPQIEGLDGGRTDVEPMTNLIPRLKEMEAEDGIFAVSLNAGFALADVPFVGPSVTVSYAEKTEQRAIEIANELEEVIWQSRDRVNNDYLTPEQAAQLAKHFTGMSKPLVIAD
jgi:microcystin degradation protein MlrC